MPNYPQPGFPFAKIYFGDVEVTTFPDLSLMSFEYNRQEKAGGGNTVNFTLLDQEWDSLEILLLDVEGQIKFEYGWIDEYGPSKSWSKRYAMVCQKYQIRITNEHTEMIVEGITDGISEVDTKEDHIVRGQTDKVYPSRISDFVIKVYTDLGFDVSGVEKTDKFERRFIRPDSTLADYQENIVSGINPTQLIQQELKHRTTGENSTQGGYYLYFEDDEVKKKVFLVRSWVPKGSLKTFYIPEGLEYEVITFEPDINMKAMKVGEGMSQKALRGLAHQRGRATVDTFRHKINSGLAAPEFQLDYTNKDGANNSPMNQNQIDAASTAREAKQANVSFYSDRSKYINNATLVIVGDPMYRINDFITIIVRKSGAGGGGLHYTTGVYRITGIKESISPGTYQTTFTLRKHVEADKIFKRFFGMT